MTEKKDLEAMKDEPFTTAYMMGKDTASNAGVWLGIAFAGLVTLTVTAFYASQFPEFFFIAVSVVTVIAIIQTLRWAAKLDFLVKTTKPRLQQVDKTILTVLDATQSHNENVK